jgi:hypothetical protein
MDFKTWTIEKHKCLTCQHVAIRDDPQQDKPGTIIMCFYYVSYAIDAREEDKCGLEARKWECQPSL